MMLFFKPRTADSTDTWPLQKSVFHDAQASFTAQMINYTRTRDGIKILINPNAELFEKKN
jgi:hypothetical protein